MAIEGDELRNAERLFRESLERDPERAEARIRLGRVLGRRGRHQDAIVELRRATMGTKNRLLLYYGNMFLGAEADALGLADEARQAYERAGELYPRRAVTAPGNQRAGRPRGRPGGGAVGDRAGAQSETSHSAQTIRGGATTRLRRATSKGWWRRCTSQFRRSRGEGCSRDRRCSSGRR